jgi:DNA repair protein RecO (recombination protein O)
MIVKTPGLVLRTLKYRDNSLIVDVYTEALGLRSYLVNGVYQKKGVDQIAYFQPLSLLELVVYEQENKNLQRIKEVKLSRSPLIQPFDITKSGLMLFCAEILRNILKERAGGDPVFPLVCHLMDSMHHDAINLSTFPQYMLLSLTPALGIQPQGRFDDNSPYLDMREGCFVFQEPAHADFMSPELSALCSRMLSQPDYFSQMNPPKTLRSIWLKKILRYYEIHLNHFYELKSLPVLSQVMQHAN